MENALGRKSKEDQLSRIMHPENPHQTPYDFDELGSANPDLKVFVFTNNHGNPTVDFANPDAVFQLNKALLFHQYKLEDYALPSQIYIFLAF